MHVSRCYCSLAFLLVSLAALTVCRESRGDDTFSIADSLRLPSGTVIKLASFETHPKWKETFPSDRPWYAEQYPDGKFRGMHSCYMARLNGPSVLLHENGVIKTLAYYPGGQRQGACRVYDQDEQLLLNAHYKDDKEDGLSCLFKSGDPWLVQQWTAGALESETIVAQKGKEFAAIDDAAQLAQAHEKLAAVKKELDDDTLGVKKRLKDCFSGLTEHVKELQDRSFTRARGAGAEVSHQRNRQEVDVRTAAAHTNYYYGWRDRVGRVAAADSGLASQDRKAAEKNAKAIVTGEVQKLQQVGAALDKESQQLYNTSIAVLDKAMPSEPEENRYSSGSAVPEKLPADVVAVWEHHWKPRKKKGHTEKLFFFTNGHISSQADINTPDPGRTWEKKGSQLIFHWDGGSTYYMTISNDGRSYDGHSRDKHVRVTGNLLSAEPMR